MSRIAGTRVTMLSSPVVGSVGLFATLALLLVLTSAWMAASIPVGFSIATVFLFAAPHNWFESRYFLSRMPARWGALRTYYLWGLCGVVLLSGAFVAMRLVGARAGWNRDDWLLATASWNSALLLWVAIQIQLRAREKTGRDWSWTIPVVCGLLALNWLHPLMWDLGLVYLHPLVALWFLDRELKRHRRAWLPAYRICLAMVPLALLVVWWRTADLPLLVGEDALTARIAAHAGAGILEGISNRLLVATHTFLETLHYGVWLLAIPALTIGGRPWRLRDVPLARGSSRWRPVVIGLLACGAVGVLFFWLGFLADYPMTRDVYFTVAMVHVLAEVPFLLRLL